MRLAATILTSLVLSLSAASAAAGTLWISGSDMGPLHNLVLVFEEHAPVTEATVSINGFVLTPGAPGGYSGQLPATLAPGELVSLVIETESETVTATDVVPEPPLIQTPIEGGSFDPNGTIPVTWTSPTDPDEFTIFAEYSCGDGCSTSQRWTLPGTFRSFDVRARDLPPGPIQISVFAYENGVFTGDVDPDSKMHIRGQDVPRNITIEVTSAVDTASWGSVKAAYR